MNDDDKVLECGSCAAELDGDDEQRPDDHCVHCYVNPDCPDGCNAEHDAPPFAARSGWECPETGVEYIYCEDCCEWMTDTYGNSAVVDGLVLCDPYEHDRSRCADCGEWCHYDDIQYDEWGDDGYCSRCAPENLREHRCEAQPGHCEECRVHRPTHMHLHTEAALCSACASKHDAKLLVAA